MSNEIYSCDFKIRCLRDPNRVLKMPMQYALVNGEKCYFPCNGCEEAAGSVSCNQCVSKINSLFSTSDPDSSSVLDFI